MKQADETENAKNESSEEMAKPSRGQKISNFFKNLGRKKDGEADNEANSPKKKKVTFFGKNKKEAEEDNNEEKGGDENKDNAAAEGSDEVPVQNGDDVTSVTSATSDASDDNDDKSDDKDDSVKKKSEVDDDEVKGLFGY